MSDRRASHRPARSVLAAMVTAFLGAAIGIAPDAAAERPRAHGAPRKHRRGAKRTRVAAPPPSSEGGIPTHIRGGIVAAWRRVRAQQFPDVLRLPRRLARAAAGVRRPLTAREAALSPRVEA